MLINKNGKMLANASQVIKVFNTAAEYNAWIATIDAADLDKFIIIKTYEYMKGCYVEVSDTSALQALTPDQKQEGILYGVKYLNKLYRYDAAAGDFFEMAAHN